MTLTTPSAFLNWMVVRVREQESFFSFKAFKISTCWALSTLTLCVDSVVHSVSISLACWSTFSWTYAKRIAIVYFSACMPPLLPLLASDEEGDVWGVNSTTTSHSASMANFVAFCHSLVHWYFESRSITSSLHSNPLSISLIDPTADSTKCRNPLMLM